MATEKIVVDNIKEVITRHLENSEFNIYVAVAWITDRDLIKLLTNKSKLGLDVRVILVDDEINMGAVNKLRELKNSGAKITCRDFHHKYCIIDHKIIITGSYNWTGAASNRQNGENIIVIEDNYEEVQKLLKSFLKLEQGKETISRKKMIIAPSELEKYVSDDYILSVVLLEEVAWLGDYLLVKLGFEGDRIVHLLFDRTIKNHFEKNKQIKIKFSGVKRYKGSNVGFAELV